MGDICHVVKCVRNNSQKLANVMYNVQIVKYECYKMFYNIETKSVCSNANPLHYYMLWVPRKADRWRLVWSIFNSHTAWADHITCGTSICMVSVGN